MLAPLFFVTPNYDKIKEKGFAKTSSWFKKATKYWKEFRTEKNKAYSLIDYLNWQNKLTEQKLNKKYIVLYTASAKNANACVIYRGDYDLEFIVESKTYALYTNNINEAYYICAFLNSNVPNKIIKPFQTVGLFGPRDIHKKILEVPFPKYDVKNETHLKLSTLSKLCVKKCGQYITTQLDTSDYRVGAIRPAFMKTIEGEMAQINELVEALIETK